MLCPEVSNFKSGGVSFNLLENKNDVEEMMILEAPFVSSVQIALPINKIHCPENIQSAFLEDSDYYSVKNYSLDLLLKDEFINTFLKCGRLTLISSDVISRHQFFISPDGILWLVTDSSISERLPISQSLISNGKSYFSVNLLSSSFMERSKWMSMFQNQITIGRLVFSWRPNDSNVCPSSLAKYFEDQGAQVEEHSLEKKLYRSFDVSMPKFKPTEFGMEEIQMVCDYIGATMLELDQAKLNLGEDFDQAKCFTVVEFRGLLDPLILERVVQKLQSSRLSDGQWICLLRKSPFAIQPTKKSQTNKKNLVKPYQKVVFGSMYFKNKTKHFVVKAL